MRICKHVLLARMGSTFLKSGPQHFTSKKPFFGPPSGKTMRHFGHFRPAWILKIRRKNEYNLILGPIKPEGPPTKCIIPAIGSLRSRFLWFFMICWRCFLYFSAIFFWFLIACLMRFYDVFTSNLWLFHDSFMMFQYSSIISSLFFHFFIIFSLFFQSFPNS